VTKEIRGGCEETDVESGRESEKARIRRERRVKGLGTRVNVAGGKRGVWAAVGKRSLADDGVWVWVGKRKGRPKWLKWTAEAEEFVGRPGSESISFFGRRGVQLVFGRRPWANEGVAGRLFVQGRVG
jgi:hypothetical protein